MLPYPETFVMQRKIKLYPALWYCAPLSLTRDMNGGEEEKNYLRNSAQLFQKKDTNSISFPEKQNSLIESSEHNTELLSGR